VTTETELASKDTAFDVGQKAYLEPLIAKNTERSTRSTKVLNQYTLAF